MDFKNDPRFAGITFFSTKVWLSSPTMHGDEQRWVDEAVQTNWVSTVGANIDEVEHLIAEYIGCKYAVALSAGTAALHLATKLAGEKLYGRAKPNHGTLEGRKVFCSDLTFDASINPVAYEDGEPVFIDTSPSDWNMDPVALENAFEIYSDVRLVVVVHLYGTPGQMERIKEICDKHGALIVEDAAESLGAKYFASTDGPYKNIVSAQSASSADKSAGGRGRSGKTDNPFRCGINRDVVNGIEGAWLETGTLGNYNCISFNGNKIITGSAGGMFLTDSKEDADKVRKWSTQSRENAPWYQHEEIGYN